MRVRYSTKHTISLALLCLLIASLLFPFFQISNVYAAQANFGYESLGSAQYTIGTGSGTTDKITGSVFTTTEDGTADSITVALKRYSTAGNEKGKCAIYLHSDLSSVGNTTEATKYLVAQLAWYTFTFADPKPSLVANTAYVLVVWVDTTTYVYMGYDGGDANQGHYQTVTYDGFPSTYAPTHTNNKHGIYCTYTVGGADVTNPTHSNVGTNTTQVGQPCLFYTLWNDNVNVSGYIFGTNNTGAWVNDTWTAFSVFYNTIAAWSNITKTLTSTLGATVQWQIWANDTSNNWDTTGIQSLVTANTFVETRYFRYDLDTVNSLLARKLLTANTGSSTSESHSKAGNVVSVGATIGILVWKVNASGVATEITSGAQVALVTLNTTIYGSMYSATWPCPLTPLASTDSIVVIVYGKFGTGAYAQFGSYAFSTEQLDAQNLDASTWTVYYYIELWHDTSSNVTWHAFSFGSSSQNSRITNFTWTASAVPKAWHDVSTWTASLVTRTWSSGTPFTFNFLTRQYISVATWTINLFGVVWNDVAIWILETSIEDYLIIAAILTIAFSIAFVLIVMDKRRKKA
jgi:hypothetical protein